MQDNLYDLYGGDAVEAAGEAAPGDNPSEDEAEVCEAPSAFQRLTLQS